MPGGGRERGVEESEQQGGPPGASTWERGGGPAGSAGSSSATAASGHGARRITVATVERNFLENPLQPLINLQNGPAATLAI